MSSDVLLVAWGGVEGDTGTWWANTGPLSSNALPTINPNHHFQPNSFAGPAVDPSARLVALVGATAPSPITLHAVDSNADISGPSRRFYRQRRISRPMPAQQSLPPRGVRTAWRGGTSSKAQSVSPSEQISLGDNRTSTSMASASTAQPSLRVRSTRARRLLVAFQGVEDRKGEQDQIRGSINGGTQFAMIPDAGGMFTSHAPALCADVDFFWMAWKGGSDENIWLSRSENGVFWTEPHTAQPIDGGINTIAGPGLAVWEGGLILAWRGVTNDQALWWSTLSLHTLPGRNLVGQWQTPQMLDLSDNSASGPSLGIRHRR